MGEDNHHIHGLRSEYKSFIVAVHSHNIHELFEKIVNNKRTNRLSNLLATNLSAGKYLKFATYSLNS